MDEEWLEQAIRARKSMRWHIARAKCRLWAVWAYKICRRGTREHPMKMDDLRFWFAFAKVDHEEVERWAIDHARAETEEALDRERSKWRG